MLGPHTAKRHSTTSFNNMTSHLLRPQTGSVIYHREKEAAISVGAKFRRPQEIHWYLTILIHHFNSEFGVIRSFTLKFVESTISTSDFTNPPHGSQTWTIKFRIIVKPLLCNVVLSMMTETSRRLPWGSKSFFKSSLVVILQNESMKYPKETKLGGLNFETSEANLSLLPRGITRWR